MSQGRFNRWLDSHFFRPNDPRSLSLFRLLYCAAILWFVVSDRGKYLEQFSAVTWHPMPLFELFHVPLMGVEAYQALYWVLVVALALTAIGAFTHVSATVAWIAFFFYVGTYLGFGKTPGTNYVIHSQNICVMVLFILSVAPGVDRTGLDGWWQNGFRLRLPSGPPQPISAWPSQLIKLTLGLAYFGAGYCKIVTSIFWADGDTLQAHLISKYLLIDSQPGLWLAQHWWLCLVFGVATLVLELTFFLVVFHPRLTWFYVVGAICFHTAIFLTMHINFFPYFGCTFLIFADWPTLKAVFSPFAFIVRKVKSLWTGLPAAVPMQAQSPAVIGNSLFARVIVVGLGMILLACVIGRVESWPFTDYRVFQGRMKLHHVRVYRLAGISPDGAWNWVSKDAVPLSRMSLNSRVKAHQKKGDEAAIAGLLDEMAACFAKRGGSSFSGAALIERTVYVNTATKQLRVLDRPYMQTSLPGSPHRSTKFDLAGRDQPLVR